MNHLEFEERTINPKEKANIFSNALFCYTLNLFRKGFKKDLVEEDLYEVHGDYQSKKLCDHLQKEWDKERIQKNPSIFRLLWKCYGVYYLIFGIIRIIIETIMALLQPYAIGKVVSYFVPGQNNITKRNAYLYAVLIIILSFLKNICSHNNDLLIEGLGIKARCAFSSFIYRKALKLDSVHVGKSIIGKIITLVTKDVHAFETFVKFGNEVWIVFLKLIVVFIILYRRIGIAALAGNAVFWTSIPILIYLGRKVFTYKTEMCKKSDETYRVIQEALSSIKIVKMCGWEKVLETKIYNAKKKEIFLTKKFLYIQFIILALSVTSLDLALYVLFTVYVKLGNRLTAEIGFFVFACFNNVLFKSKIDLPSSIYYISHLIASCKRIENIMKMDEIEMEETINQTKFQPKIYLSNVSLTIMDKKVLQNINVKIEKGLTVIKGPITSGKTSLLKIILKEYKPDNGFLEIGGTISYSSQEPWLFTSTIKQNILFGEKYDEMRYRRVLFACALEYDLNLLENGDLTIVEDGGMNLSKGQQVRINLARAVYKNRDIYLLDDCLTSLDRQVSSFIFQECIKNFLKDKAVVMTMHDIDNSREWDNVVVLEDGKIKLCLKSSKTVESSYEITGDSLSPNFDSTQIAPVDFNEYSSLISQNKINSKICSESKESGRVNPKVYKTYIKYAGGFGIFSIVMSIFIIAQTTVIYRDKLLSSWVNLEKHIPTLNNTNTSELKDLDVTYYNVHYWYSTVLIIQIVSFFLRTNAVFFMIRNISLKLHKKMSNSLLNGTMKFLERIFLGSILNRFSKDFVVIDTIVPIIILRFTIVILRIMGMLILIIYVNALFLIPITILFLITSMVRRYYLKTARNLKRLDAITRSPVIGYFNSTLEGLQTIRAAKIQNKLIDEFDRHQDLYTSASFTFLSCTKAFTCTTDVLCVIFMSTVILKFLVINDGDISPGNVGLAISQAVMFSGILHIVIDAWADIENEMISLERVLQYVDIKQENKSGLRLENWPKQGKIKYENVYLFYPDSDRPNLKNLNFTINPGEKIAIIGRTGAGKSSMISTLFRLYEFKGLITIDDVDIKLVSLDFLRSKISIIPQDAVIFSGTIRDNIDPNKQFTDEEILEIIKSVNLKNLIPNLGFRIVDNGIDLSAGQKQLICLMRTIINKNKIVILDEATAPFDPEMESIIHEVMEKSFENSTVLIIAHKLNSVKNCDKVFLLNDGELVENDKSEFLTKNSEFFS